MTRPSPPTPDMAAYALLLAAGLSHRFGSDKLLHPLAGRPLFAHAATTVADAIAGGLLRGAVAVVPGGATKLAWQLDTLGMRLVPNPDSARGLSGSLRLGLAALEQTGARAAMVILADQPLLKVEVISSLVLHWRSTGRSVRPRYGDSPDTPGHPVLIDRSLWRHAEGLRGDVGLGTALRNCGEPIDEIPMPGGSPDVDLPDDFSRLESSR